jgi:hypothetical protein
MRPTDAPDVILVCTRCGVAIELCGFCERAECPEAICARCLRIQLGESMDQPHAHGG